jgi:uncharacterized protein (UPF0335 family)
MEDEDEDIKSRSEKLVININRLKKELKEIQEGCKHSEYKIELNDKGFLVKVCKDCFLQLGYTTEQDKKDSGYII